jgi:hypothetical protein
VSAIARSDHGLIAAGLQESVIDQPGSSFALPSGADEIFDRYVHGDNSPVANHDFPEMN